MLPIPRRAATASKTPLEHVVRESLPFLAWLLVVLLIVTYFPDVYLWLPRMLGYA